MKPLARQPRRQVDPGPEHSQDEGGVHRRMLPGPVLGPDRAEQAAAQAQVGDQAIAPHGRPARQPHPGDHGPPGEGCGGLRRGRGGGLVPGEGEGGGIGIADHRVYRLPRILDGGGGGDRIRGLLPDVLLREVELPLGGPGLRHDGQGAFQGHGDQQAGEHHQPQQAKNLPGCPLPQDQPQDDEDGGGVGGGDAGLPQDVKHGNPPL